MSWVSPGIQKTRRQGVTTAARALRIVAVRGIRRHGRCNVERSRQAGTSEDELERKLEKRRAKIRSAWISFVGRIIAQIMGAVATISLGLMLVQKYHEPVAAPAPVPAQSAPHGDCPRAAHHARRTLSGRAAARERVGGWRDLVRARHDRCAHHRSGPPRRGPRRLAHVFGCLRQGGGRSRRSPESWAWTSSSRERSRKRMAECGSPCASSMPGATSHACPPPTIGPLRQTLTVQAEVAGAMARAVRDALAASRRGRIVAARTRTRLTVNPEPSAQWHWPVPESENDVPGIGMNCHW